MRINGENRMPRKSGVSRKASLSIGHGPLQRKIFREILPSSEFLDELRVVANSIHKSAVLGATEKTIEGCFERELYSLLKGIGVHFSPEKEVAVQTRRHVGKGRIDSRIGAVVIEYKRPNTFKTNKQVETATNQIDEYLESISNSDQSLAFGFLTDGRYVRIIRANKGVITSRSPKVVLDEQYLLLLVKNLISLDLDKLTPQKLIGDFCGIDYSGPIYLVAKTFFKLLRDKPSKKTTMLRSEWEEIFRLGHNDLSQQKRIQERRQVIGEIFDVTLETSEEEYAALFALHTSYALVIKLIAYKVVSEIWFEPNTSNTLLQYESLLSSDMGSFRTFCADLEDGGIIRSLGILNLLEGDFFSWYADSSQWCAEIEKAVKRFIKVLVPYIGTADIVSAIGAVDLFRDLYEASVPQVIRATFGEFYTPYWLAQHVLNSAQENNKQSILDPCCGSGTFLIAAIDKLETNYRGDSEKRLLDVILENVVGIDLNPLAVLTARVNYFLHIAHLLKNQKRELVIPVYLGDACRPPDFIKIDSRPCLTYKLTTLERPVEVTIPVSLVKQTSIFVKIMQKYEIAIKNQNYETAYHLIYDSLSGSDKKASILKEIQTFTVQLLDLEARGWNGIWARIITNFFITGALKRFDSIVGNPPWIDWKNLPSAYREKIKSFCINRGLFSGDKRTGGINLNICALISFTCAQNWLHKDGKLAFLMPKELAVQQSYQGWRQLMNGDYIYINELHDWSYCGHPFDPTKEDFMTYIFSFTRPSHKVIDVFVYEKQTEVKTKAKEWGNLREARASLSVSKRHASPIIPGSTSLTFADSETRLIEFSVIAGECHYIGREGIEFYPQELQLFYFERALTRPGTVIVRNIQKIKSKYKVFARNIPVETKYLFPLIKGPYIKSFDYQWDGVLVAFPYKSKEPHRPIDIKSLEKESPLLLKYYQQNKELFEAQTEYSDKLRGPNSGEYYGLARTGPYSFAPFYVAFRDNTKWSSCVVSMAKMPWGEEKRYVFQNHAVSICERNSGGFIDEDEAHYVCAILNAPVVEEFIYASSDQRSFKIRLPIFIPKFDKSDKDHTSLVKLSKTAHFNSSVRGEVRSEIENIYLRICRGNKH